MKFTITKVRHFYRVRFTEAPYWNTNKATRHEAESYGKVIVAKLTKPIDYGKLASWPS